MVQILGAKNLTHESPERRIDCCACGQAQKVEEAMQRGGLCLRCNSQMCVFCGCTDQNGCVHPDFPKGSYTCSWIEVGGPVCTFCHSRILEEAYLTRTGREEIVRARYAESVIEVVGQINV